MSITEKTTRNTGGKITQTSRKFRKRKRLKHKDTLELHSPVITMLMFTQKGAHNFQSGKKMSVMGEREERERESWNSTG